MKGTVEVARGVSLIDLLALVVVWVGASCVVAVVELAEVVTKDGGVHRVRVQLSLILLALVLVLARKARWKPACEAKIGRLR